MTTAMIEWDRSEAREVTTVVRVNGVERPHATVTWGQDLASALPEQVAAGGAFAHRTGTIVWHRAPVNGNLPSPWSTQGGWVPTAGQAVTVDAVDGQGHEVRCFTGLIDTVGGDRSGGMTSRIVDRIDDFNRTVRLEALTEIGAPWKDDGSIRYTAPTNAWVADDILRQCGYYSTPPKPPGHILDAPLQGTVYTYAEAPAYSNAQLLDAQSYDGTSTNPQWKGGGEFTSIALHNARLQWAPYTGPGSGRDQLRVSLVVHPNHRAPATVTVTKSNGATATVKVTGSKRVAVGTRPAGGHQVTREVFAIPQSTDITVVSVIFRAGAVDVATSAGQSATLAIGTPVGAVATIDLIADSGAAISGLQVSDPAASGGHVATTWTPSAVVRYGWHAWLQKVTPSIRDENAKAVLEEFASNLLTPVWLDEYGVARVAATNDLFTQPAVIGVDTISTVADLEWSLTLQDVRDRVEVTWSDVAITVNTKDNKKRVELWEGSRTHLTNGVKHQEHIEVPDDEEWLGMPAPADFDNIYFIQALPDDPAQQAIRAEFNDGIGSYYGGMRESTTDDQVEVAANVGSSLLKLTPWKWTHEILARPNNVSLQVPETTQFARRFWGKGMPLIRGVAKVVRRDGLAVKWSTKDSRRTLTHDMGRWCTQATHAEEFARWVHSFTSKPHPVIPRMVIKFDPRVNVGTVIQTDSRQHHGVAFQGLVVSADHDPESDTTTVAVRVVETRTTLGSYNDLRLAWNGASYNTLQALWASINGTYDVLKNDPLWKGYRPWGS